MAPAPQQDGTFPAPPAETAPTSTTPRSPSLPTRPVLVDLGLPAFTQPQPGDNAFQALWRNPYIRILVFGALAWAAYSLMGSLTHVITSVIIAYVIAYLAHPMLVWLERHRIPRGIGVLITVLIVLGMVVMTSSLLVTVVQQINDLLQHLPDYVKSFSQWLGNNTERFPILKSINENVQEVAQNGASGVQKYLTPYLDKIMAYVRENGGNFLSTILSFAGLLGEGFAVLIMSIYIMLDYDKIGLTMLRIFPRKWQPFVLDLSNNVGHAVGGYLKGQMVIATFVGVFIGIGLALFGIPSAPAIGFIAGIFNIVPYLGVVIAITPALLLAATAGGLLKIAIVVVVFVLANQIEGHLLSPMVLGRTTNLHPATVIIAILTGLSLYGIVGALLAVPLAALGKLLLQEYYYPSKLYKDGP